MRTKSLNYSGRPLALRQAIRTLLQLQMTRPKKKTSKYRSKLEERVGDLLTNLGVTYEYESVKIAYQISHNYNPDFILPNGVILECKGYWDAEDRRKIKNVTEQNPDMDVRMVFQSPYNTITKKSKTTYAQWCDRYKIPWCTFHEIPIEWLV